MKGILCAVFVVCLALAIVQWWRWHKSNQEIERMLRQWREAREAAENRKRHSLGRWLRFHGRVK
jgi:hypothetical protein